MLFSTVAITLANDNFVFLFSSKIVTICPFSQHNEEYGIPIVIE